MGDREREKGKQKMPEYEDLDESSESSDERTLARRTESPGGQNQSGGAGGYPSLPPLDSRDDQTCNWPQPPQGSAAQGGGEEGGRGGLQTQDLISQIDVHVDFPCLSPVIRHCVLDAYSDARHHESDRAGNPDTSLRMNLSRTQCTMRQRQRRQQPDIGPIFPPMHIADHLPQEQVQPQAPATGGQPVAATGASGSGQHQPWAKAGLFDQCPACHNDPRGDQCLLCGREPVPVYAAVDPPTNISDCLPQGQALLMQALSSGAQRGDTSRDGARGRGDLQLQAQAPATTGQPQPWANAGLLDQCPACHNDPRGDQCLLCCREPVPDYGAVNPPTHISDYLPQGQALLMQTSSSGAQRRDTSHDGARRCGDLQLQAQAPATTGQPQPWANAGLLYQCPACHNDPRGDQCLLCCREPVPDYGAIDPPTHISDYLSQGQALLMQASSSGAQRGDTSHDGARGCGDLQLQAQAHATTGQPQPWANAGLLDQCPACHNDPHGDQCLLCCREPVPDYAAIIPRQPQPPPPPPES